MVGVLFVVFDANFSFYYLGASECESWLCVDDKKDMDKKCSSKATETGGTCLSDTADLNCGDCKQGKINNPAARTKTTLFRFLTQ